MFSRSLSLISISTLLLSVSAQDNGPYGNLSSTTRIEESAKSLADSIIDEYYSNTPVGESISVFFSKPEALGGGEISWSEAGLVWQALIQYANLTGDMQHNDLIGRALYQQTGSYDAFLPMNQTATLANQNQSQWGLAAITAAELDFPVPGGQNVSYLQLASNVFDMQIQRWVTNSSCSIDGGLREEIFAFNVGWDALSTFAVSNLFLLSARLAKLTGNETYSEWTQNTLSWSQEIGLITDDYHTIDFLETNEENCTHLQESTNSNLGNWIEGSAVMYNATNGNSTWQSHLSSFLKHIPEFSATADNTSSLLVPNCNDSSSRDCTPSRTGKFLASLARTVPLAPFTAQHITPSLNHTAHLAVENCGYAKVPTDNGSIFEFTQYCIADWGAGSGRRNRSASDGSVVTAAAALEAVQGLLWVRKADESTGNVSEGSGDGKGEGEGEGGDTGAVGSVSVSGGLVMLAAVLVAAVMV